METRNEKQSEGKGSTQNTSATSLPKGDVNNTGVKNGVGVPDNHKDKNKNTPSGNNNRNRHFSNERPIF